MEKRITTPLTLEQVKDLKCGDSVLISGVIYTARDAAHKRLCELVAQGKELPFDPKDAVIYYVGPAPAKGDQVIGSAGPTTSYRMDAYSPTMIELGQRGMIGKGKRSPEVIEAMKKHGAVYFGAIGGAGALLSRCIKKAEVIWVQRHSDVWRLKTCRHLSSSIAKATTCTKKVQKSILNRCANSEQ